MLLPESSSLHAFFNRLLRRISVLCLEMFNFASKREDFLVGVNAAMKFNVIANSRYDQAEVWPLVLSGRDIDDLLFLKQKKHIQKEKETCQEKELCFFFLLGHKNQSSFVFKGFVLKSIKRKTA